MTALTLLRSLLAGCRPLPAGAARRQLACLEETVACARRAPS